MGRRALNPKGTSAEGPSRGRPGGAEPWALHRVLWAPGSFSHSSPPTPGQSTSANYSPASQVRKQPQGRKQLVQDPVGPRLSDSAHPHTAPPGQGLRPARPRPGTGKGVSLLAHPAPSPAKGSGRNEACSCPLSGQLGSAGAQVIGSSQGPAHLIKYRSEVSSFYRPHKALLVATSAHGSPWQPGPPQAREDEFLP